MTYTQALKAIKEIDELLRRDDQLKPSYTAQWYAIVNKVKTLAEAEKSKV